MRTTQKPPRLLLLPEVAAISRHPVKTVRRWIADGRLPSSRPGRNSLVRCADLAAFLGVPESDLVLEVEANAEASAEASTR